MFYSKMTAEEKTKKKNKEVTDYFSLQACLHTCAWIMFMSIYSITLFYPILTDYVIYLETLVLDDHDLIWSYNVKKTWDIDLNYYIVFGGFKKIPPFLSSAFHLVTLSDQSYWHDCQTCNHTYVYRPHLG